MATETPLISPILENLRRAVKVGDTAAVSAFWKKLSEQGTPLIEPIKGDSQHSLVTFIWRGANETEGVGLVINLSGRDSTEEMSRLPATDIWYKTFKVHNETRESYQFAVGGENVTDPLNPRTHVFPDDEEVGFTGWVSSVFVMPYAPLQPWSSPRINSQKGNVNSHRIRSEILDDEYPVWIYTPQDYSPDERPYGFLFLLDGWFFLHLVPTPTILDNLLDDGLIQPLVAIMVDSTFSDTRDRDLECYPPFADFLTSEVLPWARQNYNLANDPRGNVVGGSSSGGLMAAYMGLCHSDIFGKVISLSGYFQWKPPGEEASWIVRQYAEKPKLPLQFYLEAGLLETQLDSGNFLEVSRYLRDVLREKGYTVTYSEFHGGHNPMNWIGTLANGMLALLGNEGGP